jgi:hypothetical protein
VVQTSGTSRSAYRKNEQLRQFLKNTCSAY